LGVEILAKAQLELRELIHHLRSPSNGHRRLV